MDTIIWRLGTEDLSDPFSLRTLVFVQEQGFLNEFDELERDSLHLTIERDGLPVATGRMTPEENGSYKLGRIAVRKEYRGQGLGAAIVREMERKARSLNAAKLRLGAQTHARGFYERLGFSACGEVYLDEGHPHIPMEKDLIPWP